MQIYQPSEDSYLMSETLKKYLTNLINECKFSNEVKQDKRIKNNENKRSQINQEKSKLNKFAIKKIKILDLGSGSGIQAETCKKLGFKDILTADINSDAVQLLKKKGFKSIKTNLFSKINQKNKFNLIIFNPPYLPEDEYDKEKDTTAGKKGFELIINFLKQAKSYLEKDGKILLLFSSLSKPNIIKNKAKTLGYNMKLLNKKHLFFEELFVYELNIK